MTKEVVVTGSASEAMKGAATAFQPPSGPGKVVVFVYSNRLKLQYEHVDGIIPTTAEESG